MNIIDYDKYKFKTGDSVKIILIIIDGNVRSVVKVNGFLMRINPSNCKIAYHKINKSEQLENTTGLLYGYEISWAVFIYTGFIKLMFSTKIILFEKMKKEKITKNFLRI
jgi:hypothetical protein